MVSPIFRASVIVLALLAWNSTASADIISTTIYFSLETSENPPPASALDATITFTFDSADPTKLTIDFDNMSSGELSQLYFNTTVAVLNLEVFSFSDNLTTEPLLTGHRAPPIGSQIDGFGNYGWFLDFGQGNDGFENTGIIVLTVEGSGLDWTDFFIINVGNDGPAVLKFARLGDFPSTDSAFGLGSFSVISVPEPATLGLLFMGIVGIAATRLRRRTTE